MTRRDEDMELTVCWQRATWRLSSDVSEVAGDPVGIDVKNFYEVCWASITSSNHEKHVFQVFYHKHSSVIIRQVHEILYTLHEYRATRVYLLPLP